MLIPETLHITMLTWTGLVYGVVFLFMLLGLLLAWAWPRNPDGSRMSMDEATEHLERVPKAPNEASARMLMMAVAVVVTVGLAMSKLAGMHTRGLDHDLND